MNEPVLRTVIVSEITGYNDQGEVGERKLRLVEFQVKGLGLRLKAWGERAADVPPVGTDVIVEGRLNTRSYLHQESQQQRQTTEIIVSSVTALFGESTNVQAPRAQAAPQPAAPAAPAQPQLPDGGF